jgi:hypothetical protein
MVEYLVGGLGQDEWFAEVVPASINRRIVGMRIADRAEGAAAAGLPGD